MFARGNEFVNWHDQLEIIEDNYNNVLDGLVSYIQSICDRQEMRDALWKLIVKRCREGYEEYGDLMFHWSTTRLLNESVEELADLVVYKCVVQAILERDHG
jgi:hypothetical protein